MKKYTWNKMNDEVVNGIIKDSGLSIKEAIEALQPFDLEKLRAENIFNILVDYRMNQTMEAKGLATHDQEPSLSDIALQISKDLGVPVDKIKVIEFGEDADIMGIPTMPKDLLDALEEAMKLHQLNVIKQRTKNK